MSSLYFLLFISYSALTYGAATVTINIGIAFIVLGILFTVLSISCHYRQRKQIAKIDALIEQYELEQKFCVS